MYSFAVLVLALVAACSGASIADTRIVGGADANVGQIPWQVSLRTESRHFCSGAIINQRWILTAAHCLTVMPQRISVVVNSIYLNSGGDNYRPADYIRHPQYNARTMKSDIGLIRLTKNIVWSTGVQPVKLPTEAFTAVDYPAEISGWGYTSNPGSSSDRLQFLKVNVVSQDVCRTLGSEVTDDNICTLNRAGQGTCNGDSGGPVTADDVLIGIVSFGAPCALGVPDAHVRVWTYLNWIQKIMV